MADETIVKLTFCKSGIVKVEMPKIDNINYQRIQDSYYNLVKVYQTRQGQLSAKDIHARTSITPRTKSMPELATESAQKFENLFKVNGVDNG